MNLDYKVEAIKKAHDEKNMKERYIAAIILISEITGTTADEAHEAVGDILEEFEIIETKPNHKVLH